MSVTRVLSFSESIPAGHHVIYEDTSPVEGKITRITVNIPSGAGNFLELQVNKSNVAILPQTGFINFETGTPMITDMNEKVAKRERLWINIYNRDSANAHKPSVLITMEGEE